MHDRMHAPLHDLPTWLRWIIFGLTLLAVAEAAAAAAAGGAPTTAPATETKIYKFASARRLNVNGRDHLVVIATPPAGGASVRLVVPNAEVDRYSPKKDIADAVGGMQPGAYLSAETKKVDGALEIQSASGWTPRPGEDTPHGYIYMSSNATDRPGEVKVSFMKIGQGLDAIAPAEPNDRGSPAVNRLLAAEIKPIHEGDVVWADLAPGKQPTLLSIAPWSEPQQGKLTRVGPANVDGQRGYAVEIATESRPITAMIPLRVQNGKPITDQKLLAAAHKPSNGSQVFFRTFEEGGNTWLLEIEPPPKHPSAPVAQQRRNDAPPPAGIPTHSVGGAGHVPGIGGIPGGF